MTARNLTTLIAGLVLVLVGGLFLAVNLTDLSINWIAVLKTILPVLFLLGGILKLVRHFLWNADQIQTAPGKGSLLSGLFWTSLGSVLLLDIIDVLDSFDFIGLYWPVLIILFGVGKIFDYYRFKGGVSIRAGEVFGVVFIVAFGLTAHRISQVHWPAWEEAGWHGLPISIPEGFESPQFKYEEQNSLPVGSATGLKVQNLYGDTEIKAAGNDAVGVTLTKVIRAERKEDADALAGSVRIDLRMDGQTLFVGTNRESLGERGKTLGTHITISVPSNLALEIESGYGDVTVDGIRASCSVANSYGQVLLENIEGDVRAETRYRDLTIRNVQGNVSAENRRAPVLIEEVKGKVGARTDYDDLQIRSIGGDVEAANHFGSIRLSEILGKATIDGAGSEVQLTKVARGADIKNSHKDLSVEGVGGPVLLESSYSKITLIGIAGTVDAKVSNSDFSAQDLEAGLKIQGKSSELNLSGIQGGLDVATSLRKVSIDHFLGPVKIQNEYADIEITSEEAPRNPIKAENRNGAITVSLPSDSRFKLSAQSVSGQIESDFGPPPTSSTNNVAVLETVVGSPTPSIELQTTYSRIAVRKRG